ncbi:MAG TPA: hypothetical protein VME43_08145 [Bryobacteraceae bacterium]|nr:hypothetical protein [Bryobacteraceae bacterium]
MVVKSGDESIVRFDRERGRGYAIGAWVLLLIALGNMAVGLDDARAYHRWKNRILAWALSSSVWFGAPAAWAAWKAFQSSRVLSQAFVAIGPDGVKLHLVKWSVAKIQYLPLPEQRFTWEEIQQVHWVGDSCNYWVRGQPYTLTDENSPSPRTVAQLMAERKRVPNEVPALAPSGKKSTRQAQAVKLGASGIALAGGVAAGGFWLYGRVGAPYYTAGFFILLLMGALSFTLFFTAVFLAVVELNHRL